MRQDAAKSSVTLHPNQSRIRSGLNLDSICTGTLESVNYPIATPLTEMRPPPKFERKSILNNKVYYEEKKNGAFSFSVHISLSGGFIQIDLGTKFTKDLSNLI
ncbi:hypothetical protein METHB2_40116 [Candidatus Methylobacter favarea]|uniref:Uncharacterized protein n=1 Tax=Candidatus Methylobacter favarea TaxID=2707345 RepID=A0A8S0WJL8_9GAMM|nr:hypothetical protein METHB2_40116 [Candidatus Methylobacter favarea]